MIQTLSQSSHLRAELSSMRVLVVGLGGLGCPAAMALARAGVGELHLCDDDIVSESNLHRQILYKNEDIGRDKLQVAALGLTSNADTQVKQHATRLLPENARDLVRQVDLVIEGADNFATKFLAADACYLEGVPVIHGAAVRMIGTALSVAARGGPCYRCVFEDLLPSDQAPNCESAGVMGPVVGVVGALLADLAIDVLIGDLSRQGSIFSFDGKSGQMRTVALAARPACCLCGPPSPTSIQNISRELYGAGPGSTSLSATSRHVACI